MLRGMRLVASTVSLGQSASRRETVVRASTTCSRLSSTSSTARSRRCATRRSSGSSVPPTAPTAVAISEATRSGSLIVSRGTKKAPPSKRGATAAATSMESRVLPVPPGPVSVTRRALARRRETASTSVRPTKEVTWVGSRAPTASRVRRGGKVASRPSAGQLVEAHRARQVLQAVLAEVVEADPLRQAVTRQLRRGG